MTPMKVSARGLQATIRRAIEGGQHRIDIDPDGKVSILPLAVPPKLADDVALDEEIRELLEHGDGGHEGHSRRPI